MTISPNTLNVRNPNKPRSQKELQSCLGICTFDSAWRPWLDQMPVHALGWAIPTIECDDCRALVINRFDALALRGSDLLRRRQASEKVARLLNEARDLAAELGDTKLRDDIGNCFSASIRVMSERQHRYNSSFRPGWERDDRPL